MTSTIPPRSETARGAAFIASGAGAPLVLLHGVGLRLEVWAPQIAALSGSHRVIALDLPGHGESASLSQTARLPEFVRWLGDALEDLDLPTASIAGHSMGALIALGAALEFPDRVQRVALLSAVFRRPAPARRAVIDRATSLEAGQVDVEAPLDRWFGASESVARARTRDLLRQANREGYATAYRAFAEGDSIYADRLSELRCPALFLTGDGDPNSTPEMARAMAVAAPDGRLVVLPGERHMVGLTAPGAVNAALEDWLSIPAAAGGEPAR